MFRRLFIIVPLLHLYIALRLLPNMGLGAVGWTFGVAWIVASALLLPAAMFTRRMPDRRRAERIAWVGFTAMGFASNVFSLTVLRDLLLLGSVVVGFAFNLDAAYRWLIDPGAVVVLAGAVLCSILGFINARRVARVHRVDVPIAHLPAALHGFTIAQITDVHIGPTIKRGYVEKIINKINELQPDVIAVTGDMVDGAVGELAPHVAPLAELRAREGVYCVTGNHEYYSGVHGWVKEFRRLGMRVLQNEHALIERGGTHLVLAGVTDFSAGFFDPEDASDPARAMLGAPADAAARVLLAHQPRSCFAAARAGFDLQLSGHTHGGQFFPWMFLVRLQQPYTAGLHRHENLWLYACRGAGYWGPPLRLGVSSEIALIRLVAL